MESGFEARVPQLFNMNFKGNTHTTQSKTPDSEEITDIEDEKYFSGYGVAEIAELLEVPQGTVATRLRKALGLLRLELDDEN